MRTQLLCTMMVAFALAGCQTTPEPAVTAPIGPIDVGGFVQAWEAPLGLSPSDPLTNLYFREDTVFAYTANNMVYALNATGGQLRWVHRIGGTADQLRPPLVMPKGLTVIPAGSTIAQVDGQGRSLKAAELGHSVRSGLSGIDTYAYCGLDYPSGGRIAKIDLTKPYNHIVWEVMTRQGISAAPIAVQGAIYTGGEDGNVYAVNESGNPIWSIPGFVFKTDSRILADLRADNYGIYVASMDTKLYCLDPNTGKMKWQYFAGSPLKLPPEVTAESVYLPVPGLGVAAFDKTTGDSIRKPRWIALGTDAFLAEDTDFVFLKGISNNIVGVDKKTGEPKFYSRRTDLFAFASNPKTSMIYAATRNGTVLAIKPVLKAGVTGTIAQIELEFEPVALAR